MNFHRSREPKGHKDKDALSSQHCPSGSLSRNARENSEDPPNLAFAVEPNDNKSVKLLGVAEPKLGSAVQRWRTPLTWLPGLSLQTMVHSNMLRI